MKKSKYILICIAIFVIQGCTDWLDVQPTDRQTETQTFSSKIGFYSSMNGIYTKLNSSYLYGRHLTYDMIEILAKRFTIASVNNKAGTAFQNYAYGDENAKSIISGIWENAYTTILNCNIVLKNAELNKNLLGEKDYNIIKGEMLALRAFIHFDMLRLFGPIYVLNPNDLSIPYNVSSVVQVTELLPASKVIEYILEDIKNAEELLSKSDPVINEGRLLVDIEDELNIFSDDNIYKYRQLRFNYYAILVIKARVQLYAGDKVNALITAKSIINSEIIKSQFPFITSASIIGDNSNPDRMFSTEVFFGIYNKDRNIINKNVFDPETAGSMLLQPRANYVETLLFSAMPADYRLKGQWIIPNTSANNERTISKYKDARNKLLFHSTFIPLIRFSEMYLIAAECEPIVADGLAHLNFMRVNMRGNIGIPLVNITTQAALNTEILNEYSREFYCEGQMFFYYKRNNLNIPAANNGYNTSSIGIKNRADRAVLPLPESETLPR